MAYKNKISFQEHFHMSPSLNVSSGSLEGLVAAFKEPLELGQVHVSCGH